MGWLKIQKLEYLENGTQLLYETKKFLICASDGTFCFFRNFISSSQNKFATRKITL